MKFSLIVPAKNEEKRIMLPLLEYYSALHRRFGPNNFEILVVVNNTTDNTAKILRLVRKTLKAPEIKIHDIGTAEAKGEAVIHGMRQAKGQYIAFTDADGSYSAHEVMRLFRLLALSDADAIIPNRYSARSHLFGKLPVTRKVFSRIFNTTVRYLFALPQKDTQGGLKIFRKQAVKAILPTITTFGWIFDVNLLISLRRFGFSVIDTPIAWSQKEGSKLSPIKSAGKIGKELFRLAFQTYIGSAKIALSPAKS